ncbi:hypothetical protein J6590_082112 [Homalodisca vitripennis]|nr:hypothetical protein J6590_082112 [Homalodisca vitripennis]
MWLFATAEYMCGTTTEYNYPSSKKPTCHSNLGNLINVQEQHITNHECRDSGVDSSLPREMTVRGSFPNYRRFMLPSTEEYHLLPALTKEAGSELAFPSSGGT